MLINRNDFSCIRFADYCRDVSCERIQDEGDTVRAGTAR